MDHEVSESRLSDSSRQPELCSNEPPLCVDLDGTLLRTDMLQESLCALLRQSPLSFLVLPFWLLRGRAYMKRRIVERVVLDSSRVPVHPSFLEWLRVQHAHGRRLILATATDINLARPIAERIGIFSDVVASDEQINFAGKNKARELLRLYPAGFDYAGNAPVDAKVWSSARRAVVVSPSRHFIDKVEKQFPGSVSFFEQGATLATIPRAMRVHQWVKNLLLFLPLLMAHRVGDVLGICQAIIAFFAFSLCASSVYVLNDLIDLESDREHATKRFRVLASGELSIAAGMALVPVLLSASAALLSQLPIAFAQVLLVYYLMTLGYSFYLKRLIVIDIIVLAMLYAVRIFAGGVAVGVPVSQWLLAFSIFMFVSLASLKRYSELFNMRKQQREIVSGRGYRASDLEQISQFGAASGYISILVLALYITSSEVTKLYRAPEMLWLLCPIFLYWVSRTWLLAHRGEIHEDPIVYALKDRASYLCGLLATIIVVMAM